MAKKTFTALITGLSLWLAPHATANDTPAIIGDPPSEAAIHINQVALEAVGPKVAVLELQGGGEASTFRLIDEAGEVVFTGPLEPSAEFSEWGTGRQYFSADFTSFQGSGSYRIEAETSEGVLRSAPVFIGEDALFKTTAQALMGYFRTSRHTNDADRHIRIYDTDRYVDVWGGWKDAGGDNGKYLSHLSYANFFNPQQTALVPWALAKSYELAPDLFREAELEKALIEEVMWGADYLMRNLDAEDYFYMTVFDKWGTEGAERVVTAYTGLDGVYTEDYRAAFREGAGIAIAALARAARLSKEAGVTGQMSADKYLKGAERAFAHLEASQGAYGDNGVENIIDDYTALEAAIELFLSTESESYLTAARTRADNLIRRMGDQGFFISDDDSRPYYHGAEAGFPVIALADYIAIETEQARREAAKAVIARALEAQLALTNAVANPFAYARQVFQTYNFKNGMLEPGIKNGFFLPHANETGYWWQGESARLSSLATATVLGGRQVAADAEGGYGITPSYAAFAQAQMDWTLGRNPYDISMLYGFGVKNPPRADSGGDMDLGGISNGITGAMGSDEGRGITFAPGPDSENWRWVEQWLPHTTWFLLAISAMASD